MNWFAAHFALADPGFWIFTAIAIAILASNVAWLVARLVAQARPAVAARWLGSDLARAAAWLMASLWLLIPPFGAWRYGAIAPVLLGVAEIDWVESLVAGGWIAGLVIVVAVFGWLVYRHRLRADEGTSAGESRALLALRAAVSAALLQWHVAFARAGLIAWLSARPPLAGPFEEAIWRRVLEQPLYWGSWLGLGAVLGEAILNPFVRDALAMPSVADRRQGRPEALLRDLALLLATTALFVLARNFWLCLACHVTVNTLIAGWLPLYRPARPTNVPDTPAQPAEPGQAAEVSGT
ncbi:MAG: hypothetical protein N2439_16810 [Anaerolineae bacterium]|nr:hypothetical protein [Anaerolineae bacterium]